MGSRKGTEEFNTHRHTHTHKETTTTTMTSSHLITKKEEHKIETRQSCLLPVACCPRGAENAYDICIIISFS